MTWPRSDVLSSVLVVLANGAAATVTAVVEEHRVMCPVYSALTVAYAMRMAAPEAGPKPPPAAPSAG